MLRRWAFLIFLIPVALLVDSARAQQSTHSLAVTTDYSCYPVGPAVPIKIVLTNRTDAVVDSQVEMPLPNGLTIFAPVSSPAHSVMRELIYGPLPAPPPKKRDGSSVPLSIVRWTINGGDLDRSEVYGNPQTSAKSVTSGDVDVQMPGKVILLLSASASSNELYTDFPDVFVPLYQSLVQTPTTLAMAGGFGAPRTAAGYDSVSAVLAGSADLNKLDPAQRGALMSFIRGGGDLIFAQPTETADPSQSWIAPLLPVRIVGHRYVRTLHPDKTAPIPFPAPVPITDAEDAGGTIVLRDRNEPLAAYRNVGLGRIIFWAMPINSMIVAPLDAATNVRANALWRELLGRQTRMPSFTESKLPGEMPALLGTMVGSPTAAWSVAAALAMGYVGVIVLMQIFGGGTRRPMAFAVAGGASVLLTIGLLGVSFFRQQSTPLSMARITVCNAAASGGKSIDNITLLGKNIPDASLNPQEPGDPIIPSAGSGSTRLRGDTMAIENADIHVGFNRVWQGSGYLPPDVGVEATGTFGADGLHLSLNNRFSGPLRDALLVWRNDAVGIGSIAPGAGDLIASGAHAVGVDFVAGNGAVSTEQDRLRGSIASLVESRAQATQNDFFIDENITPVVAGWLGGGDSASAAVIEVANVPTPLLQSQTLVRFPVQLLPTPVGQTVHVDALFSHIVAKPPANELRPGAFANFAPYNPATDALESNYSGDLLIGFAAPPSIGAIRPTHATLTFHPAAPRQTITLRGGQVSDGKVFANPNGPALAPPLVQPIAPVTLSFDLSPGDYDEYGRVWIDLEVVTPGSGDPMAMHWMLASPKLAIDGAVTGPPPTFVLPGPPPPEAPPPKVTPGKPAPKKPKKAPTTKPSSDKKKAKPADHKNPADQ